MLWMEDGSVGLKQRNLFDSDQAFQGNISLCCSYFSPVLGVPVTAVSLQIQGTWLSSGAEPPGQPAPCLPGLAQGMMTCTGPFLVALHPHRSFFKADVVLSFI